MLWQWANAQNKGLMLKASALLISFRWNFASALLISLRTLTLIKLWWQILQSLSFQYVWQPWGWFTVFLLRCGFYFPTLSWYLFIITSLKASNTSSQNRVWISVLCCRGIYHIDAYNFTYNKIRKKTNNNKNEWMNALTDKK